MENQINDLRSAIALLQRHEGQYIETDRPVDPNAELAGVYRHIGAGGTVKRPTRTGPAMMFNSVKGYPHSRILVGMHASRERAALLLGCEPSELAKHVGQAVKKPVAPVVVPASQAPCQEQVFYADDPDFDLRKLLPAPTNTPIDAGPFFCLGLVLASDPEDSSLTDVTIHRLCVQERDELSMFLAAGRHIEVFRKKAEDAGKPLPVTINMGLDPAIYIGACFEAPTTPFGYNELGVAGALRQQPVELVQGVAVKEKAIARAEIIIEGELLPGVRVREDQHTNTGHAMPEFPGYCGEANPSLPVIKVKAVTMRNHAILQTLVGPGEEHTTLAGLPTEASIRNAVEEAIPGFLQNVYAHTAGGGKFLGILQVKKTPAVRRRTSGPGGAYRLSHLFGAEEHYSGRRRRGYLRQRRHPVGDDHPHAGRCEHHQYSWDPRPPVGSVPVAGLQHLDSRQRHFLQDDLRLHGAVGAEGPLRTGAVYGG